MSRIHISYYSKDWRGAILSNLQSSPFVLDDIRMLCVESLVQATHFDDWRHVSCFGISGPECKAMMYEVEDEGVAYWKGMVMKWGGEEHLDLLRRGLEAKFDQFELAREALIDSVGSELTYDVPASDLFLSYPPFKFLGDLNEIRRSLVERR